jgi:hypothetical protein
MPGTRFRTMLAPINASTGDGRRFATGGISLADLPMPFEWVRQREGGHDGAVAVGAIQEAQILTVKEALAGDWISADAAKGMDSKAEGVFARGVMFDDADRETMPRLAEDVAEAMHLATNGTLGPSVDLDSFEARPVMEGSDDELTWDMVEEYMEANDGAEPPIELLISAGRVRAATLVSIPAFAETSRPFELIEAEEVDEAAAEVDEAAAEVDTLALVASVTAQTRALPGAHLFALPALDVPTPITWDWEAGRVYGHIATWATCHVGYEGVCVTPPREDGSYSWFNRFTVDTQEGPVTAGRITVGGRHAGLSLSASSAMAAYDGKTTAAHVRAYADEHGIVVSGAIEPGLSGADRAVLERRKVSGDWREIGARLSLVEVLALSPGPRAHSEPGFPVETHSRNGRQVSLTASLGPDPAVATFKAAKALSVAQIVREALAAERAEEARLAARAELEATVEADENNRALAARAELAGVLGED